MVAKRRYWYLPAITAAVLALPPGSAKAQLFVPVPRVIPPPWDSQNIFEPTPLPILSDPDTREPLAPEDTPVKTRVHPEYSPPGIRQGPFMFYPSAFAGGFFDSNVFASSNHVESDVGTRFGAALRAQSLWERHALDITLMTDSLMYAHHPGLNQTDVDLNVRGKIDIDSTTQILTSFEAGYLHIEVGSLNSPFNAAEPTPYGLLSGDVTLRKQFGRWTASLGTSIDAYDFGNTRALNGSIIDQDSRDSQIYKLYERVDYAVSEKAALFAAFENNWRDLRGLPFVPATPGPPPTPATPAISLDSSGYRGLAGFDLELTHLIKGEFAAGYQSQDFVSPTINDIAGPAYRVFLQWSPTRRLDFRLNAEQVVKDVSDTSTTGVLANAIQASMDYELRPNLVLLTTALFEQDHFKGLSAQPAPLPPIKREDDVFSGELRLRYALSNLAAVSTFYRYTRRDSNIDINSYDRHLIGATATVQF